MYAIVDIAGQQFKVKKGDKIFVHRLNDDEGKDVKFDKVLLVENNGDVKLGKPIIKNAIINAQIVKHLKDDKVLVFKKKRRKGYKKLQGHRQQLSEIEIKDIVI